MKNATATVSVRMLALTFVLAAAACGGGSALAPGQGRVHFTLASGGASATASAPQTSAAAPVALAEDSDSVTTTRHEGWHPEFHDYRFFNTANVTFSSLLARNDSGQLVDVGMDLPVAVDVVAMDGGGQVSLPDGTLPAGNYDQLVVVMTQVNGTTRDSTQVSFTPPGGGWTAIVPVCPFTVDAGASTTVSLQFMVRSAFTWDGLRFHFRPEIQCGGQG